MADGQNQSFIRPDKFWEGLGLRANQVVIHLGCGPGFYLVPAAKIVGSQGKAIGVDVRADMLSEVENKANREGVGEILITHRYDIEKEKGETIAAEVADWTLVANILYQADPAKILAEAKRITNSAGTIIIVEWNTAATPLGPPADTRMEKQEVINLANSLGLTVVKEFDPSPYHYGILLKRSNDDIA